MHTLYFYTSYVDIQLWIQSDHVRYPLTGVSAEKDDFGMTTVK